MPITKVHILECYKAHKNGEPCPYPEGMDPRSAEMTMKWLTAICEDRRWNFGFGALQCSVVLAEIMADFGANRAHEVALSIERDIDLRAQKTGRPQNAHRQVIKTYLSE